MRKEPGLPMPDNNEKLVKMLKYVSEHNDFYKKRIKEYGISNPLDITQWPVLTRKELQENRYNMFSDGYLSKYYNNSLHRQTSSGLSGIPVDVYWDYCDYYASVVKLWRYRKRFYDIDPKDKYVKFTLSSFNATDGASFKYIAINDNILNVNISLIKNDADYDKIVALIEDFRPRWLYIQPFVLYKLLDSSVRLNQKLPNSIKYIESVGELLPESLKKLALDYFHIPITNMYGSEEMNCIAYETPSKKMNILCDNVYVECLCSNGICKCGEGSAIITSLTNKAMPLIRYDQNDYISLSTSNEACRLNLGAQIISVIKGRVHECIDLFDGKKISTFTLSEIIAETNNLYNGAITCFKFTYTKSQKKLQCAVTLVDSKNNWFESISNTLKSLLSFKISKDNGFEFIVKKVETFAQDPQKHSYLEIID